MIGSEIVASAPTRVLCSHNNIPLDMGKVIHGIDYTCLMQKDRRGVERLFWK